MAKTSQRQGENVNLAGNRRAFHDYTMLKRMEAGIQLTGTEVKSCRAKHIQLQEGFVTVERREAWLRNVRIAEYDFGNRVNHDVGRMRRLLLHKSEIDTLIRHLAVKGHAVVPLAFYLKQGLVKVELGLAQGKHEYDRREDIKNRETDREIKRAVANFNKKSQ